MEPKDLNTYINDKLNQGSGLRYKEEYWNDMDRLLETNMPVAKPQGATTVSKTATTGFKWSYFFSACAAIVAGVILYFQVFNTPASDSMNTMPPANNSISNDQSSSNNNTSVTVQTAPAIPSSNANPIIKEAEHTAKTDRQIIEPSVANDKATQQSDNTITARTGKERTSHTSLTSDVSPIEKVNAATPKAESSDHLTDNPQPIQTGSERSFVFETADQQMSKHSTELILIEPKSSFGTANQTPVLTENNTVPLYPKRNRLIQHIDVSPFAGMVFETGNQTYQSGNIVYTHPSQSNFTYGINVECSLKPFGLRTGIGLSNTVLETSTTSGENIYDVNTSYKIVNPNYGTTLSGKPVALVQRQTDSNFVATQYTTSTGSTGYQYLTIPITVQYRTAHNRFALMIEGGGLHQIMVSQTHSTLQPQTENHASLPVYSFQLTAGSSIRYAITAQWAVGVQYNYNLNPSGADLHFLNNSHAAMFMLTRSIR